MSNILKYSEIYNKNGLALEGYDVVALHNREILKGTAVWSVHFNGVRWLFANETHKATFEKDPEKYLPAFGGYCAYGASQGYKAKTQIHTFSIVDGRLYLNFSNYIKQFWIDHQDVLIKDAYKKWPNLKNEQAITVSFWWIYLKYQFYRMCGIRYFPEIEKD